MHHILLIFDFRKRNATDREGEKTPAKRDKIRHMLKIVTDYAL
jgi:hypothetical protein